MLDMLLILPAPAIVAAVTVIAAILAFAFDLTETMPLLVGSGILSIVVLIIF